MPPVWFAAEGFACFVMMLTPSTVTLPFLASTAITLFYKQVVRTHSIPFDLIADIPNELTVEAIEEGRKIARNGKAGYKSLSALKEALD